MSMSDLPRDVIGAYHLAAVTRSEGVPARNRRLRVIAVTLLAAMAVPAVVLTFQTPASAASASPAPECPPDCGRFAAGDPLLVPYITSNPGPDWLALPDTTAEAYVVALKKTFAKLENEPVTNVAAARWTWPGNEYGLLDILVSSASLEKLRLTSPASDAQGLCSDTGGVPATGLSPISGIPGSEYGQCRILGQSQEKGASIIAFLKGDVATFMVISTDVDSSATFPTAYQAARNQYLELPSGGVLVSSGFDVELAILWGCIFLAALIGVVLAARRREGVSELAQSIVKAFNHRKPALAVALVSVVGGMAFAMVDSSLLHGSGQWFNAKFGDLWTTWASAADMTYGGGYGHVYVLDRALETAPAFQILIAPVARLAFNLSFPYPGVVLYPTAFWIAGPLFLSAVALPICAADRWLELIGVVNLKRRLAVLGVMAVTLPTIALYGHSEDLLALGAVLYGLIAAMDGRHRAVGWWLGFALALQFLAFLAIPIALVLLKRRQWLGAIVPMIIVPLAVMVVPLVFEPSVTISQLVHQKVYDDFGYISPTWRLDPGVGSSVRAAVALAAIPVALVLARVLRRNETGPADTANLVIWALAGLFALRLLEPELVPYYLAPTLALLPLSASRAPWWRLGATCAGSLWLNWWLHDPVQARWGVWLLLVAQFVALMWLGFPQPSSATARAPEYVAKKRAAPPPNRRTKSTARAR